jgi:hypothetical protein
LPLIIPCLAFFPFSRHSPLLTPFLFRLSSFSGLRSLVSSLIPNPAVSNYYKGSLSFFLLTFIYSSRILPGSTPFLNPPALVPALSSPFPKSKKSLAHSPSSPSLISHTKHV